MRRFLPMILPGILVMLPLRGDAQEIPPPPPTRAVCNDGSPAAELVNQWFSEGKASGFDGIYYDNRDTGHSDIVIEKYLGLLRIPYPEEARERNLHVGLPDRVLPSITIGNCSMASGVRDAGSLPRIFYTAPQGMRLLFAQYLANNLYVYPEHRDHDPGTNGSPGYGDVYPANTPYLIISQGSSFSDRPFVHALLKTIGAFPPAVRRRLEERRIIAPTLQQILRSNYGPAGKPFDYLSGRSHPTVFDGKLLDEVAMVRAAQQLTPGNIPPLIQLSVVREDAAVAGIDYFEPEGLRSETLFDTNSAIARVYRGRSGTRSITVSARQSIDINNRPLSYHWVVLRGDPERIRIKRSEDGGQAEITIAHHSRRPIHEGSPIQSNRVDIGVFAHNGRHYSAPGFVTFCFLANEARFYDNEGRLLEIHYGARSQEYSLDVTSPAPWVSIMEKLRPGPALHPLGHLLRTACDPESVDKLADIHRDIQPMQLEMQELQARVAARSSELEKRLQIAGKLASDLAASQDANAVLAKTEADLEAARVARAAAQPEIDILREDSNKLARAITARLESSHGERAAATSLVTELIREIIDDPGFFLEHQAEIRHLRAEPDHDGEAVGRVLRELVAINILTGNDGVFSLTEDADPLLPNHYHHLRRLNLALVADTVFPGIVRRPMGRNFVDPRVTANKQWRDVYRYDADGNMTGWQRIEDGIITPFDARGRMLPGAPGQSPRQVDYRLDPLRNRLSTVVVEP